MAARPYSVDEVLGMIEDENYDEFILEGSDDEVSEIDTDE